MTTLLQIAGLQVAYGDERVLNGIDMEILHGEFVALIGPNGAGKTTLLRAVVGMTPPGEGRVCVGDFNLAVAPRDAKALVGFAIAPAALPDLLTGRECLALFAGARGLAEVPPASLALGEKLSLTRVLNKRVTNYSLGMRQKLGILLGLLGKPPLLLLDEPFNGLDPASALLFKRHLATLVAGGETSVLLVTHSLDIAERYASRVLLMMDGRLQRAWCADELAALRADPRLSLEQAMAEACKPAS